jgi:histidine triad (HIT) family protein
MSCVFCLIRDGKIPSTKVHEDERTLAFMDINPINPGHLLVIPKAHAPTVLDVADEDMVACYRAAKRMAGAVQRALNPGGMVVAQFNGAAAFQSVPHFHVHVIPRWEDDGKGFTWELIKGDPAEIVQTAAKIRAAL